MKKIEMIWVIKDSEAKTPTYEVIRGNIHNYYEHIGWRFEVYKVDEIIIPSPNSESKLFYFKGKKCHLIDENNFLGILSPINTKFSINESELSKDKDLRKKFDIIQNYEYKDDVVTITKRIKKRLFRKPKTWYDIKFKGFVVEETYEVIEETASSFVITEK